MKIEPNYETDNIYVDVMFEDEKYNYITEVNGKLSDDEIKSYFINKIFDVGVYPKEKIIKCKNVIIERN